MRLILIIRCIYTMHNVSRAAFDKVSSDLSQKIDTLASNLKNIPDTVVTRHENLFMSSSGSPLAAEEIPIAYLLAQAKPLPPLNPINFGKLQHWESGRYRLLRKGAAKTEDAAEDKPLALEADSSSSGPDVKPGKLPPVLSCFLEDKEGNPISETEKAAMSSVAGAFWLSLLQKKKAPKCYRQTNLEIKLQWRALMEFNFECLRYCNSHWKVDQYWINNYSSWIINAKRRIAKQEAEKRANVAKEEKGVAGDTVIDVDNDCSEGDNGSDDDNDDNDDADIEEVSINDNNKRGHPNSGETSKSKRARVEPRDLTPPAPPPPAKVTTKRARVRTPFYLTICITNNV